MDILIYTMATNNVQMNEIEMINWFSITDEDLDDPEKHAIYIKYRYCGNIHSMYTPLVVAIIQNWVEMYESKLTQRIP
jgi:hypothetical protein